MTLLEQIEIDRVAALKARNTSLRQILTFLAAEARRIGKDDGNRATTDEEVVRVLRKQIEIDEEKIGLSPNDDRVPVWENEIDVLRSYLPLQMNETELTILIQSLITDGLTQRHIGVVMNKLKDIYPGLYDPAMASRITKTLLQG